jgi:hemolysin activation/secretion protein
MHFHFNLDWRENLKVSRSFLRAETEMTYYQPMGKNGQTVLATEIGAAHIWGSFDLYHATRLGGINSLRGYRIERFTGGSSFYHSTDLRIPLVYFNNNVLPFQLGITGSFDHGRVWHASTTSDRWYYNGGGSIWINIIDAAVLRFGAHQGSEGLRFLGGLGYAF